jgi:hypothetical protein
MFPPLAVNVQAATDVIAAGIVLDLALSVPSSLSERNL